jgi:hypothetical protein
MIFDNDDKLEHWNQMASKINEKMRADNRQRTGASSELKGRKVGHPLTRTGRPDDQIGFTGLSTTKPPPIMKRERTDDSDDKDSDKGKETPNNFTSGTNVEHKAMGRLSEKGLRKGFPKPKPIRIAEPRRSSRQRLKMSADAQARYNADTAINTGFPESVRRSITQVGSTVFSPTLHMVLLMMPISWLSVSSTALRKGTTGAEWIDSNRRNSLYGTYQLSEEPKRHYADYCLGVCDGRNC